MLKFDASFYRDNFGIVADGVKGLLEPTDYAKAQDAVRRASLGMDAQSPLVTTSNAGIPAYLTNYLDPELIRVLTAPMKASEIFPEVKKGDWTTMTAQFPVVENTGEVSSYGDFNNSGSANANLNWVPRQSYLFQTITKWGERELDMAGNAKVNWAQQLNTSSVMVLNKFLNRMYFYGVSNLDNYGITNDPALSSALTPATKTAGGTTWGVATSEEIYTDIVSLYEQLQSQLRGLIDREAKMVLALGPTVEVNLTKTNQYNVNVTDQIKKNFPNLRIVNAVQYEGTSNLVQLIAEEVDGQETGFTAFNEKLRAHPVFVDLSSFRQKKTSGGYGAVIRMPIAIAQMSGV